MSIEQEAVFEPLENREEAVPDQAREQLLADLRLKLERLEELAFSAEASPAKNYNKLMSLCEGRDGYEAAEDNASPEDVMDLLMDRKDDWAEIMGKTPETDNEGELSQLFYIDIPAAKRTAADRLIDLCVVARDQEMGTGEDGEEDGFRQAA